MRSEWFPDGNFCIWEFFVSSSWSIHWLLCTDPQFIYIYTMVNMSVIFLLLLHCIILSLKYLCSNLSQIPKESLFVSFTTAQWLILPVFNFCFSFLQMSSVGNYSAFGNQICFVALKSFLGVLDVQILFRRPLCVSLEMVQNAGSAQVKSLRREQCC